MEEECFKKGVAAVGDEEKGKGTKETGWEITESKVPRDEEKQQPEEEVVAVAIDFPEGGWRAYGAVIGAVLVLLSTFGFVLALPFFRFVR